LKDVEADHVLARTGYKEVPPRVDYALTQLGRSLTDAIVPLCTWGTENMAEMTSIFAKRRPNPGNAGALP
jgi:DNA-binding HxlR family transcriptional regulator